MIKKLITILLILSLFCNNVISQEINYNDDDEENFNLSSIKWEPIPANKVVGDLELTVWITYEGVEVPRSGYFVLKKDWIEINRMLNSFDEEVARIKKKERKACDESLKEKDESCKRVNKSLRLEIDKLKNKNSTQLIEIKSLKDKNFWTLTISGSLLALVTIFAVQNNSN